MNKRERAARQGGPQAEYQHHRYTKASPEIQDKSRELAGRRSEWMCKLIRTRLLTETEKLTLLRLALYFRGKSRTAAPSMRAWPSHEELARQRGVNERTIRRHLARGEDVGFIFIEGREGGVWSNDGARRGQTNYYYLSLPDGMTLEDDGDGDRKDENDDDGDDDDDDGAEERNLDTDDQVCPNLGTDEQVWPTNLDKMDTKPGQNRK